MASDPGGLQGRVESMLARYRAWPRHFRLALERGLEASPDLEPRAIVVCGMGTSAAAGEHLAAVLGEAGSPVPVLVERSFEPPAWLGGRDLVVAVSYSGSTWETLECARRAAAHGAALAAVTAGGELLSMARRGGWPLARVEPGEYGRTSMAYLMGALAGLLSRPSGAPGEVERLAGHMLDALEDAEVDEARAPAEAIAGADAVFAVACGGLAPAARRWRTELGENTKITARDDVYPESGHNDVVALQVKPGFRAAAVILRDPDNATCGIVLEAAEQMYREAGVSTVQIDLPGPSLAYKLARSAILAGYASTLAAGLRGVDPHETPNLARYKEGVKGRLEA
ncbi:MAG: SIS domain-containing protein [Desulfurococcales archaeon]|nr:SIS domain-containing protein [Desulfurococcales archaeon]